MKIPNKYSSVYNFLQKLRISIAFDWLRRITAINNFFQNFLSKKVRVNSSNLVYIKAEIGDEVIGVFFNGRRLV